MAASLERDADRHPDRAADLCNQALVLRQQAAKLTPERPARFHVLIGTPADAYRGGDLIAAKRLGSHLLEEADAFPDDPDHGQAVHRADTVLGEVALSVGNVDRAEADLAAAAAVTPWPGPVRHRPRPVAGQGPARPRRADARAGSTWPVVRSSGPPAASGSNGGGATLDAGGHAGLVTPRVAAGHARRVRTGTGSIRRGTTLGVPPAAMPAGYTAVVPHSGHRPGVALRTHRRRSM